MIEQGTVDEGKETRESEREKLWFFNFPGEDRKNVNGKDSTH